MQRLMRDGLLFAGLAVMAACGGGKDNGSTGNNNGGGGTISVSVGAGITVTQGGSGTAAITVGRTGSFTGAVDLTLEGAPTGVSPSFSPASVAAGATTSTLTLNTLATTAAGNYTMTVRAKGTGVTDATATVSLTVNAAATPSITLSIAPTSVSVNQGASGTSRVTVTRAGGFTGAVALTYDGAPAGVTVTFGQPSLTGDTTTATVAVGAAVAAGNYNINIRGNGTGVTEKVAVLALTVNAVTVGNYTLSAAAISVQQGANGNSTVTVTRTGGFTGAVTLAVTGAPVGMTANVTTQPGTGNTGTINIAAAAGLATGNYPLTVTGTATGLANQTASLATTVTAASSGSGNVAFQFCGSDPEDLPVWVAAQDGAGAWTRVTGTNNRYQFNVTTRGGVAWVGRATDGTTTVNVNYGSAAELNATGTSRCLSPTSSTMTATVAGLGTAESAQISLGGGFGSASANGAVTIRDVPDGTRDLVATKVGFNLTTLTFGISKMLIRRNVNVVNGGSLGTIDFGSAEAFDPDQRNVTVTNAGTDTVSVIGFFQAAGGGTASLFSAPALSGTPRAFYVPAARLVTGDFHGLFVTANSSPSSANQTTRGLLSYFRLPADRTVTLPAAIGPTTFSYAATAPYVRPRAQQAVQSDYDRIFLASWLQSAAGGLSRTTQLQISSAYLNGATTWDATLPDFTGVTGWDNSWALRTGVSTTATISVTGFSASLTNPVFDGGEIRAATRLQSVPNP